MPLKNKKLILLLNEIGIKDVYKFEFYKNAILAFDIDYDQRLKQVVDYISSHFQEELLLAHEQDGTLTLIWKNITPKSLLAGNSIPTTHYDGTTDNWFIGFSDNPEGIKWNNSSQFIAQYASFSKS